jgi:hypothetical protein
MKVFVSWSGKKSRDVARAFGDWLPLVLHAIEPFVSAKDIRAGTRWQAEIAKELDDTDFGLICVTKENQNAEWLNFEAGALAKSVNSSRVVPLAVDLSPADIANPLGQFQAMRLTREDIGEVLASMNEACSSPIEEANLGKAVDKWWPDLEGELTKVENRNYGGEATPPSPARNDRELLEEVLDSVRGLGRAPMATPRTFVGDSESAERAAEELGEVIMSQDNGITAWSTRTDGNVITIETNSEPTDELRGAADAIGAHYGVRFRLGSIAASKKTTDKPE